MRIMLDTNIFISGLLFSGPERRLLQVLLSERHIIVVNNYFLSELRDVLARKFPDKQSAFGNMLQTLLVEEFPDPLLEEVQEARKHAL